MLQNDGDSSGNFLQEPNMFHMDSDKRTDLFAYLNSEDIWKKIGLMSEKPNNNVEQNPGELTGTY
jgi:hypothetical protein